MKTSRWALMSLSPAALGGHAAFVVVDPEFRVVPRDLTKLLQ